jgi:hypothetical protein
VTASTKVFWSTAGFAFERPGRYRADVAVSWSAQGVLVGVQSGVELFVDYPASDADNHAAGLVMHPEVGKWVALGGEAYHLTEAVRRLQALSDTTTAGGARAARALRTDEAPAGSRVLAAFADLLPDPRKAARVAGVTADTAPRSVRTTTRTPPAGRRARKGQGPRRRG